MKLALPNLPTLAVLEFEFAVDSVTCLVLANNGDQTLITHDVIVDCLLSRIERPILYNLSAALRDAPSLSESTRRRMSDGVTTLSIVQTRVPELSEQDQRLLCRAIEGALDGMQHKVQLGIAQHVKHVGLAETRAELCVPQEK